LNGCEAGSGKWEDDMKLPDITYEKDNHLAIISMDRPDIKNAFTEAMLESLQKALTDAGRDPAVRVILLTGREAFCAGGNVKEMAEGKLASWDMKRYLAERVQPIPLLIEALDKPTVACVDGAAYGAGFDLALACDIRIASERARFCASFVKIGLAPGDGGAYFLPRIVGVMKALDIFWTGRVITAEEAVSIGLVEKVFPPAELMKEAGRYATQIAEWSPDALKAIKRAVYSGLRSDLRSHLDYISSQLALLSETEAHRDAVKALAKTMGP
jgi:enoyl-CoA hydratase/carnithine racemase